MAAPPPGWGLGNCIADQVQSARFVNDNGGPTFIRNADDLLFAEPAARHSGRVDRAEIRASAGFVDTKTGS